METSKKAKSYKLYVCGCRGSRPVHGARFEEYGGQTTCMIIRTGNYALVIDCGTGLYDAKPILEGCKDVDVFFTHIHYDHILGLLDWSVFPKNATIRFFGAFNGWMGKETINEFFRSPFWPLQPWLGQIVDVPRDGTSVKLGGGISVETYPALHPDSSSLLRIKCGKKCVFMMFDCESPDCMPKDILKKADMLFYDGMYENETYPLHIGWGHSTWQEGCRLANELGTKRLVITHHDPANSDEQLRKMEQKAKELCPNSIFARAGDVYDI